MNLYLKWYYGYKNRGDELLLLWLINWLEKHYKVERLYIETKDVQWLSTWLEQCKKMVKLDGEKIICITSSCLSKPSSIDLFVFGGGEVFTDARPFPHNGWNYLLGFLRTIIQKKFLVLGWLGTEKRFCTSWLYQQLIWRAQQVVMRDPWSYDVAKKYSSHSVLYHDFAYDILDSVKCKANTPSKKDYVIINVNTYLDKQVIVDTCRQLVKKQQNVVYYFFSAALWSDDKMFALVQKYVPWLQRYDRTQDSLAAILWFFQWASFVLAARLHVLLVAKYFKVPFQALVYQEKIEKVILRR